MLPNLTGAQIGDRVASTAKVAAGMGGIEEALTSIKKMEKAKLIIMKADEKRNVTSYETKAGSKTLWCQFNPTSLTVTKEVGWGPIGDDDTESVGAWVEDYEDMPERTMSIFNPAPVPPPIRKHYKYKLKKKGVGNKNTPGLKFSGGKPASFGLDLFFDTSLTVEGSKRDVRRFTNDLLALTLGEPDSNKKGEVKNPPTVLFVWGKLVLFEAVVTEVEVTYMLFDVDGTPVRAKAKVGFLQHDEYDNPPQNPTTRTEPRKTWVVQQGDTVHQIATYEYGHPSHWRHIADSNNLLNPLALQPGQVLVLPPLV